MKDNLDIENFKRKYNLMIKNYCTHTGNKKYSNLLKSLILCKNFDKPDGYYYNKNDSTLYVFEHFEIDCSIHDEKGSSQLRKSSNQTTKQINNELAKSSSDKYYSAKIVEQGYCEIHGNTKTYYVGEHGEDSRNHYIKTFQRLFKHHSDSITNYIEHCKENINGTPNNIITTFLIEDISLAGTHYKNKNKMGELVDLLNTKQFFESFKNSDVDYVIFVMNNASFISMCNKSDFNSEALIDLSTKEFYILPAMPQFTFAKKLKF